MFERTRSFLQRLTDSGAEPPDDERRGWDRYPSDRDTTIRPDGDGAVPLTARVRDVSRGGVRLLVGEPLDAGAMIRVELPPRNGETVTSVLACVVHVRPEPPAWSLGCSFATELNDDDLFALGARRGKPASADQRTWERVPVRGEAVFTSAGTPDARPESAPIHNLSPTGVALRLTRPVEPGELLQLELRPEAGRAAVAILGCVVYLSEVGDGRWLAGCNFIRELDDAELRKLT